MKIQVLVASMNSDSSLIEEMNLQTDAIIINQCNENKVELIKRDNFNVKFISDVNRGVGKSRNLAIINSDADICLIADEDMVYVDGYEEIVRAEFEKNSDADMILFSLESSNPERPLYKEESDHWVGNRNFRKYGACRIAFKREVILKNNIFFSLMFGGGAKYGSGEDSLFLGECLKDKIKIFASTQKIADVKQEDSSWFTGYNEKYYTDKGALFGAMGSLSSLFLIPIMALKTKETYKDKFSYKQVKSFMMQGRREYLKK